MRRCIARLDSGHAARIFATFVSISPNNFISKHYEMTIQSHSPSAIRRAAIAADAMRIKATDGRGRDRHAWGELSALGEYSRHGDTFITC